MTRLRSASPYLLAALLTGAGATHFLSPQTYDALIPSFLPDPRAWTYASGIAEVVLAGGLVAPSTRTRAAWATAGLFVLVFPANVQMALDAHSSGARALAYARLPLQVPLVLWALQVAGVRRAAGR